MAVFLVRPEGFEHSLTLAQGAALRLHWSLIHYGPRFELTPDVQVNKKTARWRSLCLARPEGFEPTTYRFVAGHSIR